MAPRHLIGGLAFVAAMIVALPFAQGIGATATARQLPVTHVNRAAKGDKLAPPFSIFIKVKTPAARRPAAPTARDETLMDGCEPAFSPVTVPSMAHIAGRCIG